jgi:hypothetical protein
LPSSDGFDAVTAFRRSFRFLKPQSRGDGLILLSTKPFKACDATVLKPLPDDDVAEAISGRARNDIADQIIFNNQ